MFIMCTYTRLSLYIAQLSRRFYLNYNTMLQSYNPDDAETYSVWALPVSLATTQGITIVFSSSAYLDVSVQRVVLRPHKCGGFPHSEIYESKVVGTSS